MLADGVFQTLLTRLNKEPAVNATRADRSSVGARAAKRITIAPRYRMPVVLVLAVLDMVGVAAAVHLFAPTIALGETIVTTAAVLVFGGQACGLYEVRSSADLQKSARGTIALALGLLPGACLAAWFDGGTGSIGRLLIAAFFGAGFAVIGRLACAFTVQRFSDRVIEQVVIVGNCSSGERLFQSGFGVNEHVKIVGQIVVGDGDPCVPLIGRIDGASNVEPGMSASGVPTVDAGPRDVGPRDVVRGDVVRGDVVRGDVAARDMLGGLNYPMHEVDRILILKVDLNDGQLSEIVSGLEALSVPIHLWMELPGGNRSADPAAAWVVRGTPIKASSRLTKRALDILASTILIMLFAPLLLLIGLLIRLETPGPVLFRQTRLGRDGQPFMVFKFRSMYANAPATDGSVQAVRNDPRITRVGAVLRKTSIDELPQLLNVLTGTMSLVGPRPHPTSLDRRFMPLIGSYASRHRVTPGITGWAQVNGFRGETATVEQMQGRVDHDLEYIRDHSVVFDLWILLRTMFSMIGGRNAY